MNDLIDAPSMSTLPRSESAGDDRLIGSVVPCMSLDCADRERMYALFASYFTATSRARFEADLAEKEGAILLRDSRAGEIQGFSTFMRLAAEVDGRSIVAFFSGDTIVEARYWGESLLARLWGKTVFQEADRMVLVNPAAEIYWFLICSGYKTFRYLPVFFREFYPHPQAPAPAQVQRILDVLGRAKFGDRYHAESGIVQLEHAAPLRPGVAEITAQRQRDPMVAFFASRNPGHAQGDELACLTRISRSNLTRAAERMLGNFSPAA